MNRIAKEGDIIELLRKGKSEGLYLLTGVFPGHTATGWSIGFKMLNSELFFGAPVSGSLLIRTEHLEGEEFTIEGVPHQIKVFSGVIAEEVKKEEVKEAQQSGELISLI